MEYSFGKYEDQMKWAVLGHADLPQAILNNLERIPEGEREDETDRCRKNAYWFHLPVVPRSGPEKMLGQKP
jgi:hypothetical protein